MPLTFKGGFHVEEHKHTAKCQTVRMPAPARVYIPLQQHIGAPAVCTVKVGDRVLRGQKLGEVNGLGAPVHSSVSGIVEKIDNVTLPNGTKSMAVIIANDGEDALDPSVAPLGRRLGDVPSEEITAIIREAGITGMGGASFPTHAKLSSAMGKVETLIVNCAECEPYITADHRLLLEHPASVINGTKILLKALGLRHGIIAVEDNKRGAIDKLEALLGEGGLISVKELQTKYPQGDERQLIYALTGKELPAGKLPSEVGCVIFNAATTAAVFTAFAKGLPLIERIVTVDGDCVNKPGNVIVPIGTPMIDVINFCGGFKGEPKKIIAGGPMMGNAVWDVNAPIVKGSSAILCFSAKLAKQSEHVACIRCGRCVEACPMHLMPAYLAQFAAADRLDACEKWDILSCVECGTCSYVCPGQVPIVQYIRAAKTRVNEEKKAAKAREEERAKLQAEAAAKAEETAEASPEPEKAVPALTKEELRAAKAAEKARKAAEKAAAKAEAAAAKAAKLAAKEAARAEALSADEEEAALEDEAVMPEDVSTSEEAPHPVEHSEPAEEEAEAPSADEE
ncbi:MAG: electron transport complex subunit RsxC [Clostridia bacterium]|nr:electron transport complex subunit RsxC [Clostridia bacterium]